MDDFAVKVTKRFVRALSSEWAKKLLLPPKYGLILKLSNLSLSQYCDSNIEIFLYGSL